METTASNRLTRDTLFNDRKEKMTPDQIALYELMQGVNHFINSALAGHREMSTGKCLVIQYSDFLSRLNAAFESTVETRGHCLSAEEQKSEIAVFDDFFKIAEYSYSAIKEIVQSPSRQIKKEEVKLPVSRATGFGTKTMRWLSGRQGRTIAEKVSPENKVLTTRTVFSVDTKENRELMYLYKNLYEIISSRLSRTKCADCGSQESCGREWVAHMRKLLATYSRIKTDELGEIKCEKQSYQNNKLMCDLNYKIIWDAVKMLSHVEEVIQKQFERVQTRFATLLYWLIIGGLLKGGRAKIYDYIGTVEDEGGELTFSCGESRGKCDTLIFFDENSYFQYALNFYLEGTAIRIENAAAPYDVKVIDVAEYFSGTENSEEAAPDFYTYLASKREEVIGAYSVGAGADSESVKSKCNGRTVFDIASGFCCGTDSSDIYQMSTYFDYSADKNCRDLFLRESGSFAYRRNPAQIWGVSDDLDKNAPARIVQKSVKDVSDGNGAAAGKKSVCLIPDTLGDFNDGIKRQLKSFGGSVVPIPRSVAAAYAYAKKHDRDCKLTCYDFDLPVPDMTVVNIKKNKKGEYEFTRIQKKILGNNKCSLDSVLREYTRKYASTNGFEVPNDTVNMLVGTRDALLPVRNGENVLIETENSYQTIGYDEGVLQAATAPLFAFADEKSKCLTKNNAVCFLLNLDTPREDFLSLAEIKEGCREIIKRIDEGATIWNEYLPELSLEVAKGGRFAELKLIEKNYSHNITDRSMDERIDIALSDGKFTFPKGVDRIRLPLKREEFGATKRDKMATFGGSAFPLTAEKEVELKLSYSFGDPDSYRLTAVGAEDKNFKVISEWCDSEETEVICPEYDKNNQIGVTKEELDSIKGFFEGLENKMYSLVSGKRDKNGQRAIPLGKSWVKSQAKFESNLFDEIVDNRGNKISFKRNLIKKFTETENGNNCNKILEAFFKSKSFDYMFEYLISNTANSDLMRVVSRRDDKSLKFKLDNSILGFLSNLGSFFRLGNTPKRRKILNSLIDRFEGEMRSESLISASRCISDDLSVMGKVASKISQVFDGNSEEAEKDKIRVIRNISAVCWYNSEWIYNFYKADGKLVKRIEKYVTDYLIKDGENMVAVRAMEVRDIIETAFALCRLRKFDGSVFDPNAERTIKLITALKKIDEVVYENNIDRFVSRVKFNVQDKNDDGLYNVCDPCYLLITQLTGNRKLSLIGFEEN